ncbi:MAG: type II/IV secretion system ATPase subunit [Thermoplasmata archaeon]|nr:type II/IV secretion system ATPase subunit [Thermoplasmata archaeon]
MFGRRDARLVNMEIDDREGKLKFIHSIIDNLEKRKPSALRDKPDTSTDDREIDWSSEHGGFLGVDVSKIQCTEENDSFLMVDRSELPFLIFENVNGVEELLITPPFSATSLKRIEEIPVRTDSEIGAVMFDVDDARRSLGLEGEERVVDNRVLQNPPFSTPSTAKVEEISYPQTEEGKKEGLSENEEIVDEKKGFGWKGLGCRLIIFDKKLKEYRYIVREPELSDEEKKLKDEIIRLFKLLADIPVFDVGEKEKQIILERALDQIIKDNDIVIPEGSRDRIFYYIMRDFIGYGRIDIPMKDSEIEDISCDGHSVPIFVHHRKYQSIETNIKFENGEELDSFVVRLAQICGKQISVYAPIVDGKLPDGSRLQATLSKTVTDESTFTIRRFRDDPLTPVDLIENGTMSLEMAAYFWLAIEHGASILYCGGTASGKTSALNALSLFIPPSHKIVSIEDTREVNLPHKNWIAGTTREGFSMTEGEKSGKDIDMFDLLRAALRQRPRVIIVGEVRGREAYSLFQAMATGHTSYATIHAGNIHTLIQRLENPPISLPRALLTSLDIIVFINAIPVGGKLIRRITNVTEIIKMDPDTKQLIFMQPFRWISKVDDRFEFTGNSKILTNIRLVNDWDEKRLKKEMENRMKVLQWMIDNKVRSYKEVGAIIAEYYKDPESVLKDPGAALKRIHEDEKREEYERIKKIEMIEENKKTEERGILKLLSLRRGK